jgi:hypothetical protein
MRRAKGLLAGLIACLALVPVGAAAAKDAKRPPAGPLVTIHAPHPQQFEVALDEAELDWSRVPGAKHQAPARQAAPSDRATIVETDAVRARVAFPPAMTLRELSAQAASLQAVNPGAEAQLVLYEPGQPKSKATRRLLTREVGLILDPGEDPHAAVAGLSVAALRPVPGVKNGYVVDAQDPLAALDLADALRQRPGVREAYPLLRRQFEPR